jgi:hypothetical protein
VLSCFVLALAGCGGSGGASSSEPPPPTDFESAAARGSEPVSPTAADCASLGSVLSDIKVDSHTDWLFAHDVFPTDYERDRGTLDGLSGTTSSEGEVEQLGTFLDAYSSAAQAAGVETGTIPATQDLAGSVWHSVQVAGVDSLEVRIAIRALTRWVAGGCSAGGPPSGVVEPPPSATTETTETTATIAAVDVGDTATWNGDTFTVSDVETGDTAPVADLLGEKRESENGVWLSFKITPADDHSGIWNPDFTENIQVRGGDGVVYDDTLSNQVEQAFADADDFLVWIDIPEAAASGGILEVNDGLHTIDPDPSNPFVEPIPDPDYATRVNLGS